MPTNQALDKTRELAKTHFDEDRNPIALELSEMYLRYRPDDRDALLLYARALRFVGRKSESEEQFRKLMSRESKRPWLTVYAELAILYGEWGKRDLAEKHWEIACDSPNTPGWAWIMRGANLIDLERFEEAAEYQKKGAQLHGVDCSPEEAYLNLGYVLRAQGRYDDAIDAFECALGITPDYPEALKGLASLKNWSESIQQAKDLLGE